MSTRKKYQRKSYYNFPAKIITAWNQLIINHKLINFVIEKKFHYISIV